MPYHKGVNFAGEGLLNKEANGLQFREDALFGLEKEENLEMFVAVLKEKGALLRLCDCGREKGNLGFRF